jgi:hypothetical protein
MGLAFHKSYDRNVSGGSPFVAEYMRGGAGSAIPGTSQEGGFFIPLYFSWVRVILIVSGSYVWVLSTNCGDSHGDKF